MTPQQMWELYPDHIGEYDAWSFGTDADHLAELVRTGTKTATSSAFVLYESENAPIPQAGNHSIILDAQGKAVCIIRTTAVTVSPFSEVTAEHAYREGEGDRSLDHWRKVHRLFFEKELREIGMRFSEDMKVVCEEFEVVFRDDCTKESI